MGEKVKVSEADFIEDLARRILAHNPAPVIRYRLLRDVLHLSLANSEVVKAKGGLDESPHVRMLGAEQRLDGSWGRFHSRDSSVRHRIPTTEVGIERALALGLDASHPILKRAVDYLSEILDGRADFPDPPEKNERWAFGVRLFTAALLAWVAPQMPILDSEWRLWAEVVCYTFMDGEYNPRAELFALRKQTGLKDAGFLRLANKYHLMVLSIKEDEMPPRVLSALLKWIWQRETGIGYLGQPLYQLPPNRSPAALNAWFATLELLSHFSGWHEVAGKAIAWLWSQRDESGFWDFGPLPSNSTVLPLSDTWRMKMARKLDWTVRTLVLLRRFYPG